VFVCSKTKRIDSFDNAGKCFVEIRKTKGQQMITIEQLLESVDLDFEPRWVTKDGNGDVYIFEDIPETYEPSKQWVTTVYASSLAGYEGLKLAEFDGKDWTECIYEVPQNDVDYEKIKLDMEETSKQLDKISAQLDTIRELMAKRGLIKVDAVNELKEKNNG
jgi:hypothetical protein